MAEHRSQWSRLALTLAFSLLITMSALSPFSLFPTTRVQAAARRPQTSVGQLNLSGNPSYDSNTLYAAPTPPQTNRQYGWLMYPGARTTYTSAPDKLLSMNAQGVFGTTPNVSLNPLVQVQLAPNGGSASAANAISTNWYPYKQTYTASYTSPSGSTIVGYDYLADANGTMIRVLQDTATVSTNVVLSGKIDGTNGGTGVWDSTDKVLLVTDTKYNFYYAIHFADLRGSNHTPLTLTEVPTITGSTWTLTKAYASGGTLGLSIGFAATIEGSAVAVQRAVNAMGSAETTVLATTKAYIDSLLQKFPAPTQWGVHGVEPNTVTSLMYQQSYYAAVDFILADLLNTLPENNVQPTPTYAYPQEPCGKASSYKGGPGIAPGTCTWDSLFGIQLLAYSMPAQAEQAFAGIMLDLVRSDGSIDGEYLPTRKAQTAWIVYNQSHDVSFLQTIYPNLKKYLLWAEQNPDYNAGASPYKKDAEFVASWIYDIQFAIDIANVTGNSADVSMWQNEQATMTSNYQTWFLSNPNAVYEFYYTDGKTPPQVPNAPQYMDSGLAIPGLSAASRSRLLSFFNTGFAPNYGTAYGPDKALGLETWKYPDLSLTILGLNQNNQGAAASQLANGAVRDMIAAGQFSENVIPGPSPNGEAPTLFTATGLVNQTWHLNGADTETGPTTAFSFGSGGTLAFETGFETGNPNNSKDPQPPSVTTVDNGGGSSGGLSNVTGYQLQTAPVKGTFPNPINNPNNAGAYQYGTTAVLNSGQATGGSLDYAYLQAFDFSASPIPVTSTSTLSYWIYPQSGSTNPNASGSNSTCEAIDLVFMDGTALRNYATAVDQNGIRIHPAYQCQHVQLDTWNLVTVNLGAAVLGEQIVRLDVAYDQPGSTGGYSAYVDDIGISS